MLHVTNGDSAADAMRAAGIAGDILPWRDVLHDGPVPARLPLEELSLVRARFISERGWGAGHDVEATFRERDRSLAGFRAHDEVVLWFEHDLYDQLQLIQLLDWFGDHEPGAARLTLVQSDDYLSTQPPARLAERFAARRPVTDAQLSLGEDAWNAFRSPDPHAIEALLGRDTSALPFLGAALRRHLEQFPSTQNGLSRSERQALEALADGPLSAGEAYRRAHHGLEDVVWLGDSSFFSYLEDLSAGDAPLVAHEDGAPFRVPRDADPAALRVALTDAGRDVLAARADRVRLNGIDRWLGGVHLRGREAAWRWDDSAARLVSAER